MEEVAEASRVLVPAANQLEPHVYSVVVPETETSVCDVPFSLSAPQAYAE